MRTLRQTNAYMKKNKFQHNYGHMYYIGGKKVTNGYYSRRWDGGMLIGCTISSSIYCCGVFGIGSFQGGEGNVEHWIAILEKLILSEKKPYLRAETITQKGKNEAVAEALEKVGFRKVTTIPSGHNSALPKKSHYNIIVWEWLKK